METKPCSRCLRPASLSFYLLLSTVGVRPRVQQSSKSVLFCHRCLESLIDSLADAQPEIHSQLAGSFSRMRGCSEPHGCEGDK